MTVARLTQIMERVALLALALVVGEIVWAMWMIFVLKEAIR